MLQINAPGLAVLLILIGVFFYLIVFLLRKFAPSIQASAADVAAFGEEELLPDHTNAVLLVAAGGKIHRINPRARQIFNLQEGETPHLERLARKVRPGNALLKLCAAEGQARFVLEGRLVEGTSYRVGLAKSPVTVVSLRYPQIASGLTEMGGFNAQTLQTFTELAQAMAANLDLGATLQAVLENVEKLVPADFMEVTLWDAESGVFIPYRFMGLPGVERKLELAEERYTPYQGFSGHLYHERKALLIPDILENQAVLPAAEHLLVPVRAYLGLPLLAGNEFIGTLELGSMAPNAFRPEDRDLVQLLSGQAAIAIHNARLYQAEQKRTAELSGLAQLTQAFGSVRDPGSLFARLVDSIAPLVDVEILGFLLYNEVQRVLEGRIPFHGLPEPFVDLYRTQVSSGSFAEKMLLNQDVLITENAAADDAWTGLGMAHLAQAASLHETVLIPLSVGGHMLGYLQASNHRTGPMPFSQAELHLLMIVANQAASIIENANLVQQSRQRAQRAEALRRITSLASSAANLDEILLYAILELGRLLHADAGAVFILDQERGELKLHSPSIYHHPAAFPLPPELPESLTFMLVGDAQFPFTVTGSQRVLILGGREQENKPVIPFYKEAMAQWGVEALIGVPLVVRNEGIGELWFASRTADFFEQGDAQLVSTAAGQLAGVAEQSFLRGQTDESLRRRVDQLTAITRISRELSTSLNLNYLLNLVYDEALRTTHADCGSILLFDLESGAGAHTPIRFYVGDAPEQERSLIEQQVLVQDAPVLVSDFARSDYPAPHLGIQSALIVPISHQRRIAGLICLHGKSSQQFDQTSVEISQSLAVQAAVALNNALAYEEQARRSALLNRELETLSQLIQVSRVLKPDQSLRQSLSIIAAAIQTTTTFQVVVISICDPETQVLSRLVGVGLSSELWAELYTHTQSWSSIQQLLQNEFKVGEAFYIPADKHVTIPADVHVVSVLDDPIEETADAWHSDDMLLIPVYDSNHVPVGLISVDAPQDNRRPDRPTFQALEAFAAQAGLVIESHSRTDQLRLRLEALERDKYHLEYSTSQAQKNLPVMLHKELEQTIALRSLNQRMERIRASLEIAAQANRQESEAGVLHTLAMEMLTRFAMQFALIAEQTASGLRLVEVVGSFPPAANPEALFGQRNPLRQMLQPAAGKPAAE